MIFLTDMVRKQSPRVTKELYLSSFSFSQRICSWKMLCNGIESFWAYAKIRLTKFKEMKIENFVFHLKECELRFNHRQENLYLVILRAFLRNDPL